MRAGCRGRKRGATELRQHFLDLIDTGHNHLVIDLERVGFLDSTGLGVLVGILKRVCTVEGTLSLVCTDNTILKLFQITGLTRVFTIHDITDRAVTAAHAPGVST